MANEQAVTTIAEGAYLIPIIHFDLAAPPPSGRFYQDIEDAARRDYVGRRLMLDVNGVTREYAVAGIVTSVSGVSLRVMAVRTQ